MAPLTTAGLLLPFARVALGAVCDEASQRHVLCTKLKGGTSIPNVAMGTWGGSYADCASADYKCFQEHARFSIETWLNIGGTHIDTANIYRTQVSVAEALRESGIARDEVFITTKCSGAMGYEATMQCADDNLQMLGQFGHGLGYIDLLLVHWPFVIKPVCRFHRERPECQPPNDPYVPATTEQLQDTWRAMEDLKKIGVVKSIGVSDYNITNLQDTLKVATQPIDVHQTEWNPKVHDEDLLTYCQQQGIQLQAWSPLGGSKGSVLSDPTILSIAKAHNRSTAQVVLRWSVQRGVLVVVGSANPDHEQGDIALFDFQLSADEMQRIGALQGVDEIMV